MKVIINRKLQNKKFLYYLNDDTLVGHTNITFGFLPCIIEVFGNRGLSLKQNILLKLINNFPILNLESFAPFKLYENGKHIGIAKTVFLQPAFKVIIKKNTYEIRQHNKNFISVMKNNFQIALYKKDAITEQEMNRYAVSYDENAADSALIYLFCIFSDSVFYNNDRSFSYLKYERDFIPNDKKYLNRINWEPK